MSEALPVNVIPIFNRVLHASAARIVTDTGGNAATPVFKSTGFSVIEIVLDVTAAATEAGDTFDLFLQTKVGNQWLDVIRFTLVLGTGGAKRFFAKISRKDAETLFENATALSAGAVRNFIGDQIRLRWVIVDVPTSSNQSFTFSVVANLLP